MSVSLVKLNQKTVLSVMPIESKIRQFVTVLTDTTDSKTTLVDHVTTDVSPVRTMLTNVSLVLMTE
jgi:hypothetical protein